MSEAGPLLWLTLVLAGTVANDIWRIAGVWASRGVDVDSPILVWVKDVSTALVAGLVARLLLLPPGALADIATPVRLAGFALATALFLSTRSLSASLIGGEALLLAANQILPLVSMP